MKIERIELHHISQELVHPFRTSFGTQIERSCILVSVYSEGLVGWAECPVSMDPGYSYETVGTAWHIMRDFLVPTLLGQDIASLEAVPALFAKVRGHSMAKAGIENAVWDLFAKARGISLREMLGGQRDRVEVGISLGIEPTVAALMAQVEQAVDKGYGRLKIKIAPGWTLEPLMAVRERYPDIKLMADANSAFSLSDVDLFRQMEPLDLLMIEQPLHYEDILEHAKLQAQLNVPICLDESIHSTHHARWALAAKACRVLNMKVARVGGLSSAVAIHEMCVEAGVAMWCGGMLETGVGRAINLSLATMPNFTLPGDISATERYYVEDIAEPSFALNPADSTITVPTGPGIGIEVVPERLTRMRVKHEVATA